MLEDYTMEKKATGRPLITPGKGAANESKKGQDGNNGKLFQKTSRRREPNATTNAAKYEPNRKPVPQKSKTIDKRPRPRGQYSGCGKEDNKVVEDQEAEIGSVFMQGSKKQNLNHLLNFHYAPRDNAVQWRSAGRQRWNHGIGNRINGIHSVSTYRHKYNKEQYLQANCQFVVKADADYSSYANNPDTLVDWDLIEQIRVQGPEVPSCPICLYPPVAAKMTRCGHVYCWPCILHYLALSDKSWRKCPICFEAIHKQDLKSVVALPRVACNIEEEIEMRLMRREKASLLVTPVEDIRTTTSTDSKPLSVEDDTPASVYSKLLLATPLQVLSIVDREKAELQLQLSDETGCPEVCFTEQAIELLSERETILIKKSMEMKRHSPSETWNSSDCSGNHISRNDNLKSEVLVYSSAFDNATIPASLGRAANLPSECSGCDGFSENHEYKFPVLCEDDRLRCRKESVSSEGLGSEEDNTWESSITAEDLEISPSNQYRFSSTMSLSMESVNKYYYFYQAADGQHIYLHSLNVRMLERGFGSLENCPRKLRGRVLEKEAGSMTLELRKRLRCFQHLPLACQFEVAEIQLEPPLVSKDTLNFFKDQLEYRRRRRHRRAREEQRWEKRAAQEEARKWGNFSPPNFPNASHHQFPQCGTAAMADASHDEVMFPNVNETDGAKANSNNSYPVTDALDGLKIEEENVQQESMFLIDRKQSTFEEKAVGSHQPHACRTDSGVMSFAQMLREGRSKAAVADSKSLKKEKNMNEGKAALLMAAASEAAAATAMKSNRSSRSGFVSDESDDEGVDSHGSPPDYSQSFGDAIALALKKKENTAAVVVSTQGRKKKRQKQKLLFNTNMAFVGK